jgi:glutamine amidotransferase
MCELFCLSSAIPTIASFSLHAFAKRGGPNGRSVDGWGLAFYEGRDARLYREPEPAGDSEWLKFIAQRRLATRLLLSHIRRATQGANSLANTQPFARELGGRTHLFAHNGYLVGVERMRAGHSGHFQPIGETDSEVAFCALLDRIAPLWRTGAVPPLKDRLAAIADLAAQLRHLGPANFLYSDGDALFAHGHRRIQSDGSITPPGLWRLHRTCVIDRDALRDAGVMIERPVEPQELTLLASVPLTSEVWCPFGEGEIIVVKNGCELDIEIPFEPAALTLPQ